MSFFLLRITLAMPDLLHYTVGFLPLAHTHQEKDCMHLSGMPRLLHVWPRQGAFDMVGHLIFSSSQACQASFGDVPVQTH
eukprot:12297922-Karenia_brevis.AAC.1